jgi:hypothetical protein
LCWAEKADNYSAQCRTAASGNEDRARSSGESKIIVYFTLPRHLRVARGVSNSRTRPKNMTDTVGFAPQFLSTDQPPMPSPHKNKTLATFLALVLGAIGAHRFYLHGAHDRLGLLHLCCLPVAGIVYGAGQGPNIFWILLPIFISAITGQIEALVIGVTPDAKWDARQNAASGRTSHSNWVVALLLVATMLVGATLLIATIARLFDLLFTGGAYG